MADSVLTGLTADTSIGATDVMPVQAEGGPLSKITGSLIQACFQSGGSLALAPLYSQFAAAGSDTQVLWSNVNTPGGDADLVWDNSGKVLTLGASTATTQLKMPEWRLTRNPSIGFGNGDSGISQTRSGEVDLVIAGKIVSRIVSNGIGAGGDTGAAIVNEAASSTNPTVLPDDTDLDTGLGTSDDDELSLIAGGKEMMRLTETVAGTDSVAVYADNIAGVADLKNKLYIRNNWFSSSFGIFLDETNDKLEFWALYADGTTAKKNELALTPDP